LLNSLSKIETKISVDDIIFSIATHSSDL